MIRRGRKPQWQDHAGNEAVQVHLTEDRKSKERRAAGTVCTTFKGKHVSGRFVLAHNLGATEHCGRKSTAAGKRPLIIPHQVTDKAKGKPEVVGLGYKTSRLTPVTHFLQ